MYRPGERVAAGPGTKPAGTSTANTQVGWKTKKGRGGGGVIGIKVLCRTGEDGAIMRAVLVAPDKESLREIVICLRGAGQRKQLKTRAGQRSRCHSEDSRVSW